MYNRQPSSWEYCLEAASENIETEVVHGWIFKDGKWVTHAWCEFADKVIDLTESTHSMPKFEYYQRHMVSDQRCRRYSRIEFFTLVGDEKHFGPYDTELFFAETSDEDPIDVIEANKAK
ncbi:hypothetical protein SAMN05660337_2693 [Maridesulfovibrio ferrireducens]|uniref:Uncharacterized protein n=1 Tax=Maridesulfovibrio ferrireducens TaxID=246191 RepID=A0A1G9J9E5_9BACT|nr:hypothetical protein [Maridesulfovibrio ferrireducens]SDL33805.1 hypothetical protein SAMN05660337_2693 [Maridesulfovibrio ferrireducens]